MNKLIRLPLLVALRPLALGHQPEQKLGEVMTGRGLFTARCIDAAEQRLNSRVVAPGGTRQQHGQGKVQPRRVVRGALIGGLGPEEFAPLLLCL